MGGSQSRDASQSQQQPSGFGVRMTPAVLEKAGVAQNVEPSGGGNEMLQQAFQQGAEYAAQQIAQQQAEMANLSVAGQAAAQHEANEEYQRKLSARIEELQKREYRAPVKPLQCKEEREAALACYKSTKGKTPGEVYFACQQAADDLDKCAALVREAAMSKIVKGALLTKAEE